jgi:hypothetical protein
MRYVVALIVAALIIVCGVAYERYEDNALRDVMNQAWAQAWAAQGEKGKKDGPDPAVVRSQLPSNVKTRMRVTMVLQDYWFPLAGLTVVACLAGAVLHGRLTKPKT